MKYKFGTAFSSFQAVILQGIKLNQPPEVVEGNVVIGSVVIMIWGRGGLMAPVAS